ncbi:unnamed protein product [Rotaria magnacalcarata]
MICLDQEKRSLSFDETTIAKKQQIFPSRHLDNTTADERVSFSLEKEIIDDDKDEIVYSSTSNIINNNDDDDDNDDDEQTSPRTNDNSSTEETTDEEDEVGDDESDNEEDEEENNRDDDDDAVVIQSQKSKTNSAIEISKQIQNKKSFAERKQYLSIDSGHIQSESPSPVDLSPSSISPTNQQVPISKKSDPITFSYFRAPCPICRGSTYDEASTIEIEKQYYHKTCLHCYSCDKQLKENEYNYHDLSSNGRYNFYCTLHYCKSRLKQVTTTLAVATQQESKSNTIYPNLTQLRSNTNAQWNESLRLYPSLNDALSSTPHPLNIVNISDNKKAQQTNRSEHVQTSISNNINEKIASNIIKSKTFDESLSRELSDNNENLNVDSKLTVDYSGKYRFKRSEQNRRSSPISSSNAQLALSNNTQQSEANLLSVVNRKKKKILIPQSNLNLSSSSSRTSSQSLDDERQRTSNERRRQRDDRQKELLRFRRSQEIQRELEEIEEKRFELDKRHVTARQYLNSFFNDETKKTYWERECLCIVRERTGLQRATDELLMSKRGLTLENERSRAENEYRQLINLPDEHKTIKDKEREEQLIIMIAKLVEAKNNLTLELDQMRLRELQEDECLHHAFQLQGIEQPTTNFHTFDTLKDII